MDPTAPLSKQVTDVTSKVDALVTTLNITKPTLKSSGTISTAVTTLMLEIHSLYGVLKETMLAMPAFVAPSAEFESVEEGVLSEEEDSDEDEQAYEERENGDREDVGQIDEEFGYGDQEEQEVDEQQWDGGQENEIQEEEIVEDDEE